MMPADKEQGMGFHVYRFEITDELSRNGANVVYKARDTVDASDLQLYEWTPPLRQASAAASALDELAHELHSVEVFSSGTRLYLAATGDQARKALEELRDHHLFPGAWPGLFEDPSEYPPGDEDSIGPEPHGDATGSGRPSRIPLGISIASAIILAILCIALAVQIGNLSHDRDAKDATIRSLSDQLDDRQKTIDSLNSQIKQKDDLLVQRQAAESRDSRTIFRLAEEAAKATSEYTGLELENGCLRRPIYVAVRYLSLHGSWVTRGWWTIDYGQKLELPDVYSKDGVFYLYAETHNPFSTWNGSQENDSIVAEVVDDGFLHEDGQDLDGSNKRTVSMFRRSAAGEKQYSTRFTCSE